MYLQKTIAICVSFESKYISANIFRILIHAVGLGSWTLLLAKAIFTSTVGVIALQMYLGMSQPTVNSHYY